MWQEFGQINKDKGCCQIINPLDIATSWMTHCPGEQNTNHHYLDLLRTEEFDLRLCSVNVYFNLLNALYLVL